MDSVGAAVGAESFTIAVGGVFVERSREADERGVAGRGSIVRPPVDSHGAVAKFEGREADAFDTKNVARAGLVVAGPASDDFDFFVEGE